jgi:hypothetical protein
VSRATDGPCARVTDGPCARAGGTDGPSAVGPAARGSLTVQPAGSGSPPGRLPTQDKEPQNDRRKAGRVAGAAPER